MNIFFLDEDAKLCAQAHCDKDVIKMILEYAKIMSTAHRVLDPPSDLIEPMYKILHKNHPVAKWVRESKENYQWTYDLWFWLCKEYWWRYDKIHKTWEKLYNKLSHTPLNIPSGSFTSPALCMPRVACSTPALPGSWMPGSLTTDARGLPWNTSTGCLSPNTATPTA